MTLFPSLDEQPLSLFEIHGKCTFQSVKNVTGVKWIDLYLIVHFSTISITSS